jgi:hypothetical protein
MYTRVNDIIRLDRGPGSSLGDTLLAASLNVLTIDQPSAELMTPVVAYEPLCVNQAAMIALLVIMPTPDDVGIAPVQRARPVPRHGHPWVRGSGRCHWWSR